MVAPSEQDQLLPPGGSGERQASLFSTAASETEIAGQHGTAPESGRRRRAREAARRTSSKAVTRNRDAAATAGAGSTAGPGDDAPDAPAGDDPQRDAEPARPEHAWSHHSQVPMAALTPMMRHYVQLKQRAPQRLLLYRLGDFYECFFEDAICLSTTLELTLTGKDAGKGIGRVPMAGIPHHALDRYGAQLVQRGFSVAICDQLEDAATASGSGLLRRDVTRVITPGTVIEEGMLNARRNNWLAAVLCQELEKAFTGLAIADVSTGEFLATELPDSSLLHQELLRIGASELLLPHHMDTDSTDLEHPHWCPEGAVVSPVPRSAFQRSIAEAMLLERFQLSSTAGLGLAALPLALCACGGVLRYLQDTQRSLTVPLALPKTYSLEQHLQLDHQTRRHLELTETQRDSRLQGSLLWAIDQTQTAMGGRCLRRWLQQPLLDLTAIVARQDTVAALVVDAALRQALRRVLRPMGDLERLAGRAGSGTASPRDLVGLADGLERLERLAKLLRNQQAPYLQLLQQVDADLQAMAVDLQQTLVESPPLTLQDGGLIRDGVDETLDDLRDRLDADEVWLQQLEQQERLASGISNLRVSYSRSFGYYIGISRSKASQVPGHYMRRQTLTNEERFFTPELKEREGRILALKARSVEREYHIFCALRERVGCKAAFIRSRAAAVAELDTLTSLAELAATSRYCRPVLEEGRVMVIEGGRHPVVEQNLVQGRFVENDVQLGTITDMIILTGPNASGKSCYLRQTGLLQLLAQIGSFVPARQARLGICDRIFTRVGAVDDLAAGQSTFMVEMSETANILHHASDHSLVLLDEIGRGTATFDGLAIAWAVAEDLATRIGARTIFATHYHELNALAQQQPNVANYQVVVAEEHDRLVFLHQVRPGGADRSYGIEAARLAGMPTQVVLRARQVLGCIEANSRLSLGPLVASAIREDQSV